MTNQQYDTLCQIGSALEETIWAMKHDREQLKVMAPELVAQEDLRIQKLQSCVNALSNEIGKAGAKWMLLHRPRALFSMVRGVVDEQRQARR
jgi:hypothetical protein